MAKINEQIDRIFEEGLAQHQEQPSLKAWDKLEAHLDAGRQPKKNFWWAIAAAMPLLLGIGYLIWSQAPQVNQESSLAGIEEVLEVPPVPESTPEAEMVVSEEAQYQNSLAETITPSSSKSDLKSSIPQGNSKKANLEPMVAEAITFPSPQAAAEATGNSNTDIEIWVSPEPPRTITSPTSSQANLAAAEEVDGYRIRIFSNGLKKEEASPKNLITELGKTVGQVEGLLEKLDEGFGEIQDRKERIFSSLTSRKSTPNEK